MWTHFWDMHSGGGQKLDWGHIYIEAPENEARSIFYAKFGRSPDRVTCTCCGPDYSVSEHETIDEATEYHRGEYDPDSKTFERKVTRTVEEYFTNKNVKRVYADEIEPHERTVSVPEQGYVWRD